MKNITYHTAQIVEAFAYKKALCRIFINIIQYISP